jgi:hypothetical protein
MRSSGPEKICQLVDVFDKGHLKLSNMKNETRLLSRVPMHHFISGLDSGLRALRVALANALKPRYSTSRGETPEETPCKDRFGHGTFPSVPPDPNANEQPVACLASFE